MFFLEIAMLNGRAEQDFCTLARDECADPLLDTFMGNNLGKSWTFSKKFAHCDYEMNMN